jgi:Ca2+-binding EF-hand superfamily protein
VRDVPGGMSGHYDPKKGGQQNLVALVKAFRQHAVGPPDDMHLSHVQFRKLCMDMNLGSAALADRLFAAMDDDNTGALDVHEFFAGMQALHYAEGQALKEFAFNLFNVDRGPSGQTDETIDANELRDFVLCFYEESCDLERGWVRRWIRQFEAMFGERVAAVRVRGREQQLEWAQAPAVREIAQAQARAALGESTRFARGVLDFTERVRLAAGGGAADDTKKKKKKKKKKGEKEVPEEPTDGNSMGRRGFLAWCGTDVPSGIKLEPSLQLQVLPWLGELGESWRRRMLVPAEARALDATPPTALGFKVAPVHAAEGKRRGGLRWRFERTDEAQMHLLFSKHAGSAGLLSRADFDRWLLQLGLPNAYLRRRLFGVFEPANPRFLDFDEFLHGVGTLCGAAKGKSSLDVAFQLFDIDGNGSIGEEELRAFLQGFFGNLGQDVHRSLRVLESLLSPEAPAIAAVTEAAREARRQLTESYIDAVVTNVYQSAGMQAHRHPHPDQKVHTSGSSSGPRGLRAAKSAGGRETGEDGGEAAAPKLGKFYISEFERWCRENDNTILTFLDSLAAAILGELEQYKDAKPPPQRRHLHHEHHRLLNAAKHRLLDVEENLRNVGHGALKSDVRKLLTYVGVEHDAARLERRVDHDTTRRLAISSGDVGRAEAKRLWRRGEKHVRYKEYDEAVVAWRAGLAQQGVHEDPELSELLREGLAEAEAAQDERDAELIVHMLKRHKQGGSTLALKAAAQKQPKGAPKVPPPSSCFSRDELRRVQGCFFALSQDGVMGPSEWVRCLHHMGVTNDMVALRLFEIFDTSGDLSLNAKEFACGLSEICTSHQAGKTPEEVRREFAFRYYDANGEGQWKKRECIAHLRSYRISAQRTVQRCIGTFEQTVLGLNPGTLVDPILDDGNSQLTAMGQKLDADLRHLVEEIYILFANDKSQMSWSQFETFTLKAPRSVEWLTSLGQSLRASFRAMEERRGDDDGTPALLPNFEQEGPAVVPLGAVVNNRRMNAAFGRYCGSGGENAMMDEEEFRHCVRSELQLHNRHLARMLFSVFTVGDNSTITRTEFRERWRTVSGDDHIARTKIAFQLHDVKRQGYLDKDSLRLFFISFFDDSLNRVQGLRREMDEWLNGEAGASSESGQTGLPNYYFVGLARQKKLELATSMERLAQAHASVFVDGAVKYMMRYAVDGRLTEERGFPDWLSAHPGFLHWLSVLPAPWMSVPTTEERPDPEMVVLGPTDVGRPVEAALARAQAQGVERASCVEQLAAIGPGSGWWARAMDLSGPRPGTRTVLRPRSAFDRVSLLDIKSIFGEDVASHRVYTLEMLTMVLERGLGLTNKLVADRLYRMFDVNADGNLGASEVATGLLILAYGSQAERLQLAFELFDTGGDGLLAEREMHTFLCALRAMSLDVIESQVELLGELFGPPPTVSVQVRLAKEFQAKILRAADTCLQQRVETLRARAFAADAHPDAHAAAGLTRSEFELFLTVQPALTRWVAQLGIGCLEALAPLEDKALSIRGSRPLNSAYRARRKFPLGTAWDQLRSSTILGILREHASMAWLDLPRWSRVLQELRLYEPHTLRRTYAVLSFPVGDERAGGVGGGTEVCMRDGAAALLLLSSDGWRTKLRQTLHLYDANGHGALHRSEWAQLLRVYGALTLDIVATTVGGGLLADLLGAEDAGAANVRHVVVGMSHARLSRWVAQLEDGLRRYAQDAAAARARRRAAVAAAESGGTAGSGTGGGTAGSGKADPHPEAAAEAFLWEDIEGWAEVTPGFTRWLESLRNLWTEQLLEYESVESAVKRRQDGALPTALQQSHARRRAEDAAGLPPPPSPYGFAYAVKKVYELSLERASRHPKRLPYRNTTDAALTLSLHTDYPSLLSFAMPRPTLSVPPQGHATLRLVFEALPRQGGGRSKGGNAKVDIRLWLHNEASGDNEECLLFRVSYCAAASAPPMPV